ncbi:E3 ubiquitin-protein ligase TRIM33-like isoform X1 [Scleropages formosus]|uniref:E3 ubiquitin-protein ligase TRIM33-like isoform X1 n=2 Tax=Scleropages formosus TaxID=113540 RepID=UPI0010FABCAD|nr:E3 ubiquitin-protein ligase TRIM33-like isoform X1 [Scleropages formosus]
MERSDFGPFLSFQMSAGGREDDKAGDPTKERDGETEPAVHPPGSCAACRAALGSERRPQLLPCLHSLCRACLPRADGAFTAECPACKGIYTHLAVKSNPFIKETPVWSGAQKVSKCGGCCEDTAVIGWCKECGEALCSACVLAHRRVRVTRDHTVLQQPSGPPAPPFCPIHKEEQMKLFCLSCDQLTCRDCQLSDHRNHRFNFIEEAAVDVKMEVRSLMEKVKHQKELVKRSLWDLHGRLLGLAEQETTVKKELRDTVMCIRNALVKQALQLAADVQELCGSERANILVRQGELRRLQERQDHVLGFTELALNADDHTGLLVCKKQIQVQLEGLLFHSTDPPASKLEVKFCCNDHIYSAISNLGKILKKDIPFAHPDPPHAPSTASDCRPPTKSLNSSSAQKAPTSSRNPLAVSSAALGLSCPPPQGLNTYFSSPFPSGPSLVQAPHAVSSYAQIRGSFLISPPSLLEPVHTLYPPVYMQCQSDPSSSSPSLPTSCTSSLSGQNKPFICTTVNAPQAVSVVHCSSSASSVILGKKPPSIPVSVSSWTPSIVVLPSVPVRADQLLIANLAPRSMCTMNTIIQALPAESQKGAPTLDLIHSTESTSDAGVRHSAKEKPPKNPCAVLPVKAPADSPCERVSSAGRLQEPDLVPASKENEPTSTVLETASTVSREGPVIVDLINSQTPGTNPELTHGITAHAAMEASSAVNTNRYTFKDKTGAVAPDMTAPSKDAESSLACATVDMSADDGDRTVVISDITNPDLNAASRMAVAATAEINGFNGKRVVKPEECRYKEASPLDCVHLPASGTECMLRRMVPSIQSIAGLPSSFKEALERCCTSSPPASLVTPSEAQQQDSEIPTSTLGTLNRTCPSPKHMELKDLEDTYHCPIEDDEQCSETVGTEHAQDSRSPVGRQMLPQVSLFRIPISAPALGSLPRFRLFPGTTKNEILLKMIEEEDQPAISPNFTSESSTLKATPHLPKARKAHCTACRLTDGLILCSTCGRSFHRDCHIPPVGSSVSSQWRCTLCWDLSDVGKQCSTVAGGPPNLCPLDQRRCEYVLLVLMCRKCSSVLQKPVQVSSFSSQYVDLILIRGRLLQKLMPPYQTPSEFVSDVWVLLDSLLKKEPSKAEKLQRCFETTVNHVFGRSLYMSLLKHPCRKEREGDGARKTLKRLREFLSKSPQEPAKRICTESQ